MGDSMTCITFQYHVVRYDSNILSSSTANGNNDIGNISSSKNTNSKQNSPPSTSSSSAHSTSASNSAAGSGEKALNEKIAKLCEAVARDFKCSIQSSPVKQNSKSMDSQIPVVTQKHSNLPDKGKMEVNDSGATLKMIYSITATGPFNAVMSSKQALIRKNPSQTVITINTIRNIILSPSGEMKPIVKKRLDDLKQATGTEITCLGGGTGSQSVKSPDIMNIEIVGELEATEKARLLALALLDELINVNPKIHAILAGRKREDLNLIMQQTGTNFYFPIPFILVNSTGDSDAYANTIYITGQPEAIQEASKRYLDVAKNTDSQIITKKVSCLHRKLDWLYSFRKDKIRKIMADNAVDVSFPALGSTSNMITVSGLKKNLIDRAIRSVKQVICNCYLASIQTANAVESAEQFIRFCGDLGPILTRSNALTGVEIMINRNIIEIYGTDIQAKPAYTDLTGCEIIKIRDTKFQIELSFEHRDFINGKKNGKINRITKTSGCRISFQESQLDVNMMIDLYSAIPSCLLMGVSMLEEELPAEMSFHIPETYHKRIIGVGGKNIQKIMKRFGVYVKFSNMEEYEQLGGYYENADNVICRTPSKNAENLRDLKASIVEAVNATDLLETIDSIDGLPRQLSQWFCGTDGSIISAIAQEFRVRIYLPDKESGLDLIGLEGPESSLQEVKNRLQSAVPALSDFQVPGTSSVAELLSSPEFVSLKEKLLSEYLITVWIATSLPDTNFDYSFFLIHPDSISQEQYEEAKQSIILLFNEQNVPFAHELRSESYANLSTQLPYDSFQHFNSKLLAPVASGVGGSSNSPASTNERETGRSSTSGFGAIFAQKSSASGSVQDIRSLFDDASGAASGSSSGPPGLIRSNPSEIRTSVIARPIASGNMRRPMSEKSDYLRHPTALGSRPSLTMQDIGAMNVSKSNSMTDIIQSSLDPNAPPYHWGGSAFGKSLSSSAIVQQDTSLRPSGFSKSHTDYALVSPTDIEFDQKMEDQVQALDKQNSDESDRIARVLQSIDHSKYLSLFIEHEIDYHTFLSLEDADLKELGIKALGSRKKILSCIKECHKDKSPEQRLGVSSFDF